MTQLTRAGRGNNSELILKEYTPFSKMHETKKQIQMPLRKKFNF